MSETSSNATCGLQVNDQPALDATADSVAIEPWHASPLYPECIGSGRVEGTTCEECRGLGWTR